MHQLCNKYSWEDILALNLKNHTIILDIDGVVMAHAERVVPDETRRYIEILKAKNDIHIVSNGLSKKRKVYTSEALDIPWVDSGCRKPNKRILSFMEYDEEKPMVIIGDKILTDGLFAIRIKAKPLLLERRVTDTDPLITKVTYLIDDTVYSLCKFFFAR
ncbi:HAD family hydrolase [Candidatus Kaiserbacteria bacterium]|nr:MAG: HAD family hydrolase [Candidatus Kaiserbacteria bacterium]